MTDPLGQSQVIPYLAGLSSRGFEITVLSAEKKESYLKSNRLISDQLQALKINWEPVFYTKKPPILSTLFDIIKLQQKAKKTYKQNPFKIVHCRSYISAFVGLKLQQKWGCNFIFDMRGFYADERVDGNIWNLNNPLFKLVYWFFKKKEQRFLKQANHVVSLTESSKREMLTWNIEGLNEQGISVIPCCADFEHFNFKNQNNEQITDWKQVLNISDNSYVLSYLGSIGTWYLLDEMLKFFAILKKTKPQSVFLFITPDHPDIIIKRASIFGIDKDFIRVQSGSRTQVPELISVSDASIFFIKPVWSKMASSPTKLAELMGMGIPIVTNSGVGDVDAAVAENPTGVLVHSFSDSDLSLGVEKLLAFEDKKSQKVHELACELFSLERGISTFEKIYKSLS